MRDPTRGGLASVMHEIAQDSKYSMRLEQEAVPVRPEVQSVCEMLGYDPFYLAREGRVVAVVGEITAAKAGEIVLATPLGGERFLQELEEDPLPRIC